MKEFTFHFKECVIKICHARGNLNSDLFVTQVNQDNCERLEEINGLLRNNLTLNVAPR